MCRVWLNRNLHFRETYQRYIKKNYVVLHIELNVTRTLQDILLRYAHAKSLNLTWDVKIGELRIVSKYYWKACVRKTNFYRMALAINLAYYGPE